MGKLEELIKSANDYQSHGRFSQAIRLYQKVLKEAKPEERAKVKRELALYYLRSGDLDSALKEAREAEESFARLGDEVELARARLLEANVLMDMGKSEEARDLSMKVYQSYRQTGQCRLIGLSQRMLGRALAQLGDYRGGEDFFQDSLSSFRLLGDEGEVLICYNCIANLNFSTSDYKRALINLEKGLAIAQKSGNKRNEALILSNMGMIYRRTGKWVEAEDYLNRSLEIKKIMGDPIPLAHVYISLARLKALQRELGGSEELLKRALTLAQEHGYEREEAMALESLGDVVRERGDLHLAREYYQRTLDIGRRLGQKDLINQVQRRRAELFIAEGKDLTKASECIQEALRISQSLGDRFEEGCCYRTLGKLSQARGDSKSAEVNFEKAVDVLRSIEDRFEQAKTLLAQGESSGKVDLLREAHRFFAQIQGAEFYQALVLLQIAKVEPSLQVAIKDLGEAERIFRARGEEEKLKEVENLKLELNRKLTQPTTQKYKVLRGLASPELGEIFEGMVKELKVDKGFVAYRSNGKMTIGRCHNLAQEEATKVLSLLSHSNGFHPGEPLILYDTRLDNHFSSLGAGSIMVTPFISGRGEGKVDGYLYLARQANKEPFLDREYDLFYSLSHLAGRAIAEKRQGELERELAVLKKESEVLTRNPQMLRALEVVKLAKDCNAPVLLRGETGTGKDLLARIIHQRGARRDRGFVEIHCGAIPKELVESELFGHERGAFTGAVSRKLGRVELAEGGTLFLNEVGELPESTQVKLLRFLDSSELERVGGNKTIRVDTRIIAATNKDLEAAMERRTFRKDLYYRLNVFRVELPPLRERKEDIPLLVHHFIKFYGDKYGKKIQGIAPRVLQAMMEYEWPGNVRELKNEVERAAILANSGWITPEVLSERVREQKPRSSEETWNLRELPQGSSSQEVLRNLKRQMTEEALQRCKGNRTKTAQLLGITRQGLSKRLRAYREVEG